MKAKFKILAVVALAIGFANCSNSDEPTTESAQLKSVTVKVVTPSTYSIGETAVGKTPTVYDATLYFMGSSGVILATGTMTQAEIIAGKIFNDIPGDATRVQLIGNAGHLDSPDLSAGTIRATQSTLLSNAFWNQTVQTDPVTGVNVIGEGAILGASGSLTATVSVVPAVSRIEIKEVSADPAANIPLTSFRLTGIYINNTYAELGLDYTTLPTLPGDILNYGSDDPIWAAGYPPTFYQAVTGAAGTSFTAGGTNVWAFFALPVVANSGTIINGAVQTSVPHIILKIEDATAPGNTFPNPAYLTIKDFKRGAIDVEELIKGKVFSISNIAFGGEHLAAKPEISTKENVAVTVVVSPWTDDPVTPEF